MREKRERGTETEGKGDREGRWSSGGTREIEASGTSRCEMLVHMQEKFQIVLLEIPPRNAQVFREVEE